MNNKDFSKLDKEKVEKILADLYADLDAYRDEAEKLENQIKELNQKIPTDRRYTKRDGITQKVADKLFVLQSQYCAFCRKAEELQTDIEQAKSTNKYAKDYEYDKNNVSIDTNKSLKDVYKEVKKRTRRTIIKKRVSKFANKVFSFKGAKKIRIPKKTKTSSVNNMDLEQLGKNIAFFFENTHSNKRLSLKAYDLAEKYIENQYFKFCESLTNRKKQEKENMTEEELAQKKREELQEKMNLYNDYIDFKETNDDFLVAHIGNVTHQIAFDDKDKAFEILQERIDDYEASRLPGMEPDENEYTEEMGEENSKQEQSNPKLDRAALPDPSTSIGEEENKTENKEENENTADTPKKESEILKEKWQEDREAAKELYDELYSKLDDVKARKQEIYDFEKQERQELADLWDVKPISVEYNRTEENANKLEELDAEENRILENIHSELGHLNEMNRQDAIDFKKAYDAKVKEENFDPVKAKLNEMDELYWKYKSGEKGAHFTDEARAEVLAELEKEREELVAQNMPQSDQKITDDTKQAETVRQQIATAFAGVASQKASEENTVPVEPVQTPVLTQEQIEQNKQKVENNPFVKIDRLNSMEEIVSYITDNLTEEEIDKLNEYKEQYKRDYPGVSEKFCYQRALMGIENDRRNNKNQSQTKSNAR